MKHALVLIELELQEKYYKQCVVTAKSLESRHQSRVLPFNKSFKQLIEENKSCSCNALYASFVLYHLSDEEIELLKTEILPNCEVVIIPNRNKERGKQKNSHHLNRPEEVAKLLSNAGFTTKIDTSFEKGYSIIIGTK